MSTTATSAPPSRRVAIIGNPNSGKTTVFNALTGLRQKVANYSGVTVEKKEGTLSFDDGAKSTVIDLPGTYSLSANSPDEQVAVDVLLGKSRLMDSPDLVVCVADSSNIERNLYLVSQILDRRLPLILALNMIDLAEQAGTRIDINVLEDELGIRVIPLVASRGKGIRELKGAIREGARTGGRARQWTIPKVLEEEVMELADLLRQHHFLNPDAAFHESMALLSSNDGTSPIRFAPEVLHHVKRDHARLDFLGIDRQSAFVEARYSWIKQVCTKAFAHSHGAEPSLTDRIDRLLTHKIWGYVFFFALMSIMFQSVFTWAQTPMEWIGGAFDWAGRLMTSVLPPGDLRGLVVHGAIAGVAAVVTFLPQILFLFFFLSLFEDTGYMARAAFIMDRLMSKVGLHGKSFIPLLSSFACAIPGIMATRTIENPRDRLATMLIAPLMSCSARLPVYTLLIGAFVPATIVFGFLSLPALTLLSLYLFGLVAAICMAWALKKTLLKSKPSAFLMELPPYRLPSLRSILLQMWERSKIFLKGAGTFILGVSIILWFLASYPKMDNATPAEQLRHSFAGRAGHLIEPLIKPLGFDWKIGIGLIGSLLQREVFVSTMGTIYNIKDAAESDGSVSLRQRLQEDRDPETGAPAFTILTALCLMVYYAIAMQCMSTVVVMRRETNGWRWPAFQFGYMTVLAYTATFFAYRIGMWLGLGG